VSACFRFPLRVAAAYASCSPEGKVFEKVCDRWWQPFRIWNRHRSDTDRGGLACPVRFRMRLVTRVKGRRRLWERGGRVGKGSREVSAAAESYCGCL
jgi:hypothetical protein